MGKKIIRIIDSWGEKASRDLSPLIEREMSNAQENRLCKLLTFLVKGFKKEADFMFLLEIAELFLQATAGKDKDQVKTVFRSFTRVPRFPLHGDFEVRPKIYKKLNTLEKERYCWGKRTVLDELFDQVKPRGEKFRRYIRILKLAKASK